MDVMSTPKQYESLTNWKIVSCRREYSSQCTYPPQMSLSNVPHTHADVVGTLHRNELGPFAVRAVRHLDHTLVRSLLTIDPRKFILSQIDMRNSTIGGQVCVIHRWDYGVLAKLMNNRRSRTYTMRLVL